MNIIVNIYHALQGLNLLILFHGINNVLIYVFGIYANYHYKN